MMKSRDLPYYVFDLFVKIGMIGSDCLAMPLDNGKVRVKYW